MPTAAILLATTAAADQTSAATLSCGDGTVLGRLLDQLATLDVDRGWVVTRPQWESDVKAVVSSAGLQLEVRTSPDVEHDLHTVADVASQSSGQVVLASANIVTHREALAGLLADPRVPSGILTTTARRRGSWTMRTRAERGRVVSAGSPYHKVRKPTGYFLSVVKVAQGDVAELIRTSSQLAELVGDPMPERWNETFENKRRRWRHRMVRRHLRAAEAAVLEAEPVEGAVREPVDDAAVLPGDAEAVRADVAAPELPELTDEFVDEYSLDAESEQILALRAALYADDALPLVLVGLVRSRVHLVNSYLRELFWARPLAAESAALAFDSLQETDEDKVLLSSAVKGSDGFFTTFFVSPYSRYIARWCAKLGLTPNIVTSFSMLLGIVAAVGFATGSRAGLIAGAVLLQAAFTFDCVDGQLARYTRQFSKLGAWLDSVFDRGKEYVVFAGLAIGATVGFGDNVWLLAAAALGLQTLRHNVDFAYAASRHNVIAKLPTVPLDQPEDRKVSISDADNVDAAEDEDDEDEGMAPAAAAAEAQPQRSLASRIGRAAIKVSRAFERRPWMRWAKKIIVLPIGERFALISLTAAIWEPRVTFVALLIWSTFALAYQLTGKILRTVAA